MKKLALDALVFVLVLGALIGLVVVCCRIPEVANCLLGG